MSQRRFSLVVWVMVLAVLAGGIAASAVQAQTVDEAKTKVEEMPEDPARHYNLGVVYYKYDKYNDAIASFQEAVNLKEDYKEALDLKVKAALPENFTEKLNSEEE